MRTVVCVRVRFVAVFYYRVFSISESSTSCCLIEIQMRIAIHQTHISLFWFLLILLFCYFIVNDDGWLNSLSNLQAFDEMFLCRLNHFQVGMYGAKFRRFVQKNGNHKLVFI